MWGGIVEKISRSQCRKSSKKLLILGEKKGTQGILVQFCQAAALVVINSINIFWTTNKFI